MARSGWSTSNYFSYGGAVLTAAPLTMACWAKTSVISGGAAQMLMALHQFAAGVNRDGFDMRITSGNAVSAATSDSVNVSQGNSTGTISANTWFHAATVFASATSRQAFLNGSGGTVQTTSRVPSGIDRTLIGISSNLGAVGTPFAPGGTGFIVWPAIWNIALSAADIGALAAGADPRLVRPDALVSLWPLVGEFSPEINIVDASKLLTMVGTLTAADDPPLQRAA